MPFLFPAGKIARRKNYAPAGCGENASLILAFGTGAGLHKHTSSPTPLFYKAKRNKPFCSFPFSNLAAAPRHSSNCSTVTLHSAQSFGTGSLDIIHPNRVGLAVF